MSLPMAALSCLIASAANGHPFIESNDAARLGNILDAATAAEEAWPGYKFLGIPFLLVQAGKSAVLVGHPAPPIDFNGTVFRGFTVFVSTHPPDIGFFFRRQYAFHGASVNAVQYPEAQAPEKTVGVAIHERFHDHQLSWQPLKDEKYPGGGPEDVALASIEQECLAKALETEEFGDLRCFLALRMHRYRRFPVSDNERDHERGEGTAKFVEYKGRASVFGHEGMIADLAAHLRKPLTIDQMGKWRSYYTGAALCLLLERQRAASWQIAIEGGKGPFDLLSELYPLSAAEERGLIAGVEKSPEYARLLSTARHEIAARLAMKKNALARFSTLGGIRVLLKTSSIKDQRLIRTYFASSKDIELDDDVKLLDPADTFEIRAPDWECRIQNTMVLYGRDVEFVFSPSSATSLDIDGKALVSSGMMDFKTLEIRGPGITVSVSNGKAVFDGKRLEISD